VKNSHQARESYTSEWVCFVQQIFASFLKVAGARRIRMFCRKVAVDLQPKSNRVRRIRPKIINFADWGILPEIVSKRFVSRWYFGYWFTNRSINILRSGVWGYLGLFKLFQDFQTIMGHIMFVYCWQHWMKMKNWWDCCCSNPSRTMLDNIHKNSCKSCLCYFWPNLGVVIWRNCCRKLNSFSWEMSARWTAGCSVKPELKQTFES